MSKLEQIIKNEIIEHGPMNVGRFMDLCLGHPKYGYYITRDPFGVDGDFTTAPEISQMFGEMVGAWVIDTWQKLGVPKKFTLMECGAGRGTLMADIIRVAKNVPDFLNALEVVLLETSPVLIEKQKDLLSGMSVSWLSSLDDQKSDVPIIVIANEFLDALPIRQFQKVNGKLKEQLIGISKSDELHFGLSEMDASINVPLSVKDGEYIEVAPVRDAFMATLCQMLKTNGGAGLFIDYGYDQGHGYTLQAVEKHKFVSPLENTGNVDITAHVDFSSIKKICANEGMHSAGIIKQADFLRALGIVMRAEALKQKATPEQTQKISQDLDRLISLDQMGKLFKVFSFSSVPLQLAGFNV